MNQQEKQTFDILVPHVGAVFARQIAEKIQRMYDNGIDDEQAQITAEYEATHKIWDGLWADDDTVKAAPGISDFYAWAKATYPNMKFAEFSGRAFDNQHGTGGPNVPFTPERFPGRSNDVRVDAMEKRLDEITSNEIDLGGHFQRLAQKVDAMQETIDKITEGWIKAQERVDELEAKFVTIAGRWRRLADLEEKVDNFDERITYVQTCIDEVARLVGAKP